MKQEDYCQVFCWHPMMNKYFAKHCCNENTIITASKRAKYVNSVNINNESCLGKYDFKRKRLQNVSFCTKFINQIRLESHQILIFVVSFNHRNNIGIIVVISLSNVYSWIFVKGFRPRTWSLFLFNRYLKNGNAKVFGFMHHCCFGHKFCHCGYV